MITITVKRLEDFTAFLINHRATNYLFYDVRQCENGTSGISAVNFHFLGVLGTLNILFQHAENLPIKMDVDSFMVKVKATLAVEGISFVEGVIKEIFLSLS
ncbi:MAG: hypothetical protein JW839_01240 [Candidatus Lokiarchaeota archaeon]|nr:hypothetical protein [Candidatus Lokiarchaeota archaeon]